jgi:hypothetical protein
LHKWKLRSRKRFASEALVEFGKVVLSILLFQECALDKAKGDTATALFGSTSHRRYAFQGTQVSVDVACPALIVECSVDGMPYATEADVVTVDIACRHLLKRVGYEAAFTIVHFALSLSLLLIPLHGQVKVLP